MRARERTGGRIPKYYEFPGINLLLQCIIRCMYCLMRSYLYIIPHHLLEGYVEFDLSTIEGTYPAGLCQWILVVTKNMHTV